MLQYDTVTITEASDFLDTIKWRARTLYNTKQHSGFWLHQPRNDDIDLLCLSFIQNRERVTVLMSRLTLRIDLLSVTPMLACM